MKEEIWKAIIQLKNGKVAGPDDIPAEALKVDIKTFVDMLYPLFMKNRKKNEVPKEWKKAYLIKLPKGQI